ncbi:MAG: hypothetical protein WCY93_10510 [Anaerolineaceae bacterium]
MNINEFKSRMDAFGGPQRSHMFTCDIFGTHSEFVDDYSLRFFCKTVAIPGINFSTVEYNPRNFGMPETLPTNIAPDPLNCIFIMDSDQRILSFFHEWMQRIVNFDTTAGLGHNSQYGNDQLPYEIAYKSDYTVNMAITMYGTDMRSFYTCELQGVYPTQVGQLNLSWEDNDSTMSLPVNFSYNKIFFSGLKRSGEISQRGLAPISYYMDIGRGRPGALQSLVNGEINQLISSFWRK